MASKTGDRYGDLEHIKTVREGRILARYMLGEPPNP